AAPVCADNLSKRTIRNTLLIAARKTKAMTQPATTSNSISRNRGRKRATLRRISSMVLASSPIKFCHIQTSLSAVPQLSQVRLFLFKFLAQQVNLAFHLLRGRVPVLRQESMRPSPKQRDQRLHDVIAPDDG